MKTIACVKCDKRLLNIKEILLQQVGNLKRFCDYVFIFSSVPVSDFVGDNITIFLYKRDKNVYTETEMVDIVKPKSIDIDMILFLNLNELLLDNAGSILLNFYKSKKDVLKAGSIFIYEDLFTIIKIRKHNKAIAFRYSDDFSLNKSMSVYNSNRKALLDIRYLYKFKEGSKQNNKKLYNKKLFLIKQKALSLSEYKYKKITKNPLYVTVGEYKDSCKYE